MSLVFLRFRFFQFPSVSRDSREPKEQEHCDGDEVEGIVERHVELMEFLERLEHEWETVVGTKDET